MNSTRILDIKEESARILVQYGNGYWSARMTGTLKEADIFNDMNRIHYLWSVIDNSFLDGSDVYVGDTVIADNDFETVHSKIQHYNGIYEAIDLSDFTAITPDDGDGGTVIGGGGETTDHYRAGSLSVVAGANAVTFIKDGVPSALPSTDYILDAYVIATSGQMQTNIVPTSKTAGGFVASDVIKAGTLYYTARLTT
jgi:hypothetical protein